jgi:hypothetical protein
MKLLSQVFARANIEAARIILSDPQRYEGLMLEWARRIVENERPDRKTRTPGAKRNEARRNASGLSV